MDTSNSPTAADTQTNDEQAVPKLDKAKTKSKSRIAFVYSDLEAAISLADTLRSNAGTECEVKQLASWMNRSADGGTFRSILGAAKSFGLVETQHAGRVSLTKLGQDALNHAEGSKARVDAFLNVPLHAAMYSQYEGSSLPPSAAIERHLETLGVPPKQTVRARQTFTKSADFAGFIDPSTGRFIRPATVPLTPALEPPKGRGPGGDSEGLDLDPLLMALLRKIPPAGQDWPKEPRARWFRTFAMNVSQIYDTGAEVVDLVIKIEGDKSVPQ